VRVEVVNGGDSISEILEDAPYDSVHICQGIRANGIVGKAQALLRSRCLEQWVVMESILDVGFLGLVKRLEYFRLLKTQGKHIQGILAIGKGTPRWIAARGFPKDKIYPFAYFIAQPSQPRHVSPRAGPYKFIYVGRFVRRKRLDWLISALGSLKSGEFELTVIGSGPLGIDLEKYAAEKLKKKVRWVGRLPMLEVPRYVQKSDCLVLPSAFDGWGVVVSEALLCGTPVICSDGCGSAGVVEHFDAGSVFNARDFSSLQSQLRRALDIGRIGEEERDRIRAMSKFISAEYGANYLIDILACQASDKVAPRPAWEHFS
jgi:glycosyltransferase involved in cell wall biosynthesis